jgi:two-component system, response regulator
MGYRADLSKVSSFEVVSRIASLLAIRTAHRVFVLDVTRSIRLDTVRKILLFSLLLAGLCDQNLASTLQNAEKSGEPFKQLSLEQPGKIEFTTVSKGPVETTRTPTAISVITLEGIRRSGATSIPEMLRLVPGVEVARIDSSKWSNGVRGLPAWRLPRRQARRKSDLLNEVVVVRNSVEALNYLSGEGAYADRNTSAMAQVVLLDFKLPKLDGLEALRRIRADDRINGYGLGASSYVRKPGDFNQFSEAARQIGFYWTVLNERRRRGAR